MTQFTSPKYGVGHKYRQNDCYIQCQKAITSIIQSAFKLGWREEEVALNIAEVADEYIVYLATKPAKKWHAANSNHLDNPYRS